MDLLWQIALWPLHNHDLGYINDTAPLTDEMVPHICSSYLRVQHAASRKGIVLQRLRWIIATQNIGAQSIPSSSAFREILQLLESSDAELRLEVIMLITLLASRESFVVPTYVLIQVVESLGLMLHDNNNTNIVKEGLEALSRIAFSLPGTEAIAASDALEHTQKLLASDHPELANEAAFLIGRIARRQSWKVVTIELMMEKFSCERIVSHSHQNDTSVLRKWLFGVFKVAHSGIGAQCILNMDTKALELVVELLDSPVVDVRADACLVMTGLFSHETALPKVLAANPLPKLAELLRRWDQGAKVKDEALAALCQIARWKMGAEAIFRTDAALVYVAVAELDSPNLHVRSNSCRLIAELSSHEMVLSKVLATNALPNIVQLRRKRRTWPQQLLVTRESLGALCQIASWKLGAEAIFNTPDALDTILKFKHWESQMPKKQAELLRNLTIHRPELGQEVSN
ncbi:armadillo-type protein [Roridomyces roridus]|uniref:Armadillo-type protein n=1 Tax=Roridomyces roridus TaxID=1738132 RepID=A0AAD7FBW8_9AGAR|nr:armadillo-type protein [Roridomyces roridus]